MGVLCEVRADDVCDFIICTDYAHSPYNYPLGFSLLGFLWCLVAK